MTVSVRKFTNGDKQAVLNLHEKTMGTRRTETRFDWKYLQPPDTEQPRIIVAEKDKEVIGYVGDFQVPLQIRDMPITARQPVDIMISEEYRSAKLFVEMIDKLREAFTEETVVVEFGEPTQETRKVWQRFEDWSFCNYDQKIRIYRPATLLPELHGIGALTKQLVQLAGIPLRLALRVQDWVSRLGSSVSIDSVQFEHGYVDSAFGRPPTEHYPVCIRRNQEFWNWRIKDPQLETRTYWVGNQHSPDAVVLVARNNMDNSCQICLQERRDENKGIEKLLNIYCKILHDYRDVNKIESPSTLVQSLVGKIGMTHEQFIKNLSNTKIGVFLGNKFNMNFGNFGEWVLGWRWCNNDNHLDIKNVPLSKWEFSPLLLD